MPGQQRPPTALVPQVSPDGRLGGLFSVHTPGCQKSCVPNDTVTFTICECLLPSSSAAARDVCAHLATHPHEHSARYVLGFGPHLWTLITWSVVIVAVK